MLSREKQRVKKIFFFQIWIFRRMNGMQEEINQLKGKIHNITLFEQEISDFNKMVSERNYFQGHVTKRVKKSAINFVFLGLFISI